MERLPPALDALRAYRQFILWRADPHPDRPGKTQKRPIDWRTMHAHDAHDPAIWLDADEAIAVAAACGERYGVGFVFTAQDDKFFVDIDGCLLPDGSWSPLALQLIAAFPGAAVEISHSGNGLHIIGTGTVGEHGCKNVPLNLEFYTQDRFVALTGNGASGDAGARFDHVLPWLTQYYFPPGTTPQSAEWTSQPVPEWSGPEDDETLIARALHSVSAQSVFSGRASFKDLWEANADALSRSYPDNSGPRAYDASSADAALAQHLAFWTGNNCERMLRIMQQSALKRDKWEREDYLFRTITRACAKQSVWYSQRRLDAVQENGVPAVEVAPPPPVGTLIDGVRIGPQFLGITQLLEHFKGCVYVLNDHKVFVPGGSLLKPDQFRVAFGGYTFALDSMNSKVTKSAWEAFTESQAVTFPRADVKRFLPARPPGEIVHREGRAEVNYYWPIETPRQQGDVWPFINHMMKLFPNAQDLAIILSYMAAMVQHIGIKFQWWPIIQGIEGNGKTLIGTIMAECIGQRYSHFPNTHELADSGQKFNAWVEGNLFICLEELKVGDRLEMMDILKPIVTNRRLEIQGKGSAQITGDNYANGIGFSNHKDAVVKNRRDRRYAVFFTPQQEEEDLARDGMTGRYFPELWAWLNKGGFAIINNFLRTYPIPDELNPAKDCVRAPKTSNYEEVIAMSLGTVEQEIMEAIEQNRPGFAGGWVSSMQLDTLLQKIGAHKRVSIHKRRELMLSLGYDVHPHLNEGRPNAAVLPDGGRPRLYVKRGHILCNLRDPKQIAARYSQDQQNAAQIAMTPAVAIDGGSNNG